MLERCQPVPKDDQQLIVGSCFDSNHKYVRLLPVQEPQNLSQNTRRLPLHEVQ